MEWPAPEKPDKKKTTVTTKNAPSKAASSKLLTTKAGRGSNVSTPQPEQLGAKAGNDRKRLAPSKAGGKENRDDDSKATTATGTPLGQDSREAPLPSSTSTCRTPT